MKYKYLIITPLLFILLSVSAVAATVDTAITYSAAMKKNIKAIVVKPDSYNTGKKYPTVYLLHGFSGNYADWITKVPNIKNLADKYQVLIVCADGAYASWYFDSPQQKDFKYETYVATELVSYVDKNYSTITNRNGRAITGLSMGGHGALYLAMKHQDVFGAAGSMSGGVDIRIFSDRFGVDLVLGKYSLYPDRWEQNSVINMVYLLTSKSLAITFDCGYDDFMLRTNIALHDKLLERGIPHDFTIRPGGHTWEYWGNSIKFQMVFFDNFFNKLPAK
jgi:S-formylglutathione hydrolase FrmB